MEDDSARALSVRPSPARPFTHILPACITATVVVSITVLAAPARAGGAPRPGGRDGEPVAAPGPEQVGRVAHGAIAVEVVDPTGAAVDGADVLVQRDDGAVPVQAASDGPGRYRASALEPGRYLITVVKTGFAALTREVVLNPGGGPRVAIELAPAGISELVEVTPAAGGVDETALKAPATLHETPRSVTVMEAVRLREQNFRFVSDALAYVPGVAVNSYRTGGYHFYARGYRMGPDDTRVDGFAGLNAGGRYSASLFGVDHVVFLRGPAGILYGSAGAPGGLINLITKKPQAARSTRVDLRVGSYAGGGIGAGARTSGGFDIDSTGPVARQRRVFYRTLVTIENMQYFTAGVDDRNRHALGALTFQLDDRGRYVLTPTVQWSRLARPLGGGIVVSPSTSLATNDGSAGPVRTADLSPHAVNLSAGGGIDEIVQGGADFRGLPTARLRLSGAYRFIANDTHVDQFAPQVDNGLLATRHLVPRVQTKSDTDRRAHNYDLSAAYELKQTGAVRTLVQTGVTGRLASTRTTTPLGPLPGPQSPIDIYTGRVTTALVSAYPALAWGNWTDSTYWTSYVQSQTSIDGGRWVVSAGLGYGENRPTAASPAQKSGPMPNGAVVFNVDRRLALYGSYATSYTPTDPSAEDVSGRRGTFGSTMGVNAEAGAKYELPNGRASWTVALFHNHVANALVQSGPADLNPNGNRYYAAAGTRRSRGVEVTADVALVRDLRVTGGVTYLHAIYTGEGPESAAATLAIPGSRAEKSPDWAGSAWARYDRSRGRLAGLGGALGIVWQGERLGSNGARTPAAPDPLQLPSFTRVDTALFYRLSSHVDVGLNVENLLDEVIFVSGSVGSSLEVAAPRTVSLRLGYRF